MSPGKALVISPHPDDLEIGMGGTVRALSGRGVEVTSLVVTDGGRSANPLGIAREELVLTREREARESSRILEIEVFLLGLTDMESEANKREFECRLREFITARRPDEMYIPHPEIDRHKTHRTVSRIAIDCLGSVTAESPFECECWCYEVWTPFPSYDRIEDITPFVDAKSRAVEAHKSQTAYKDYTDGMLGLNRYRGVFHDTHDDAAPRYAEVFVRYNLD